MTICVYGASSDKLDRSYLAAAYELGSLIALRGDKLVFGGGNSGIMGACARGAADAAGEVLGIAPRFFDEPGILFDRCTDFLFTETMRERKQAMEETAEAFIALPGGIGTFEEFFEILTLKQLGRHAKPIAVLNTMHYYEPMDAMLRAAADGGFMSESCFQLFDLCRTPAEALEAVHSAPAVSGSARRLIDYIT